MRRSPRLEEALPVLHLLGLSAGDFSEGLEALLGPKTAGLSATTINRLLKGWQDEYRAWRKCSLKGKELHNNNLPDLILRALRRFVG